MDYATRVFNYFLEPDLILCNSMLKGYTQNHMFRKALFFYLQFLQNGFSPDNYTFPYILKTCAAMTICRLGQQIHASLIKNGSVLDVFVFNSLLDMYCKCGQSEFAMKVFQGISEPSSTSWNIMICGFLNSGDLMSAQKLFDVMPYRDVSSWNTMLSAYAKCGELENAKRLFYEMPVRNLVSWNALIAGFSQNERFDEALSTFSEMLKAGIRPDKTTILSVVSAVSAISSPEDDVVKQVVGFARAIGSVSVLTAVLDMYAKLGRIDDAGAIFDEISEKDLVSWNAMISGYSQNQKPAEAIQLFRNMQSECRVKIKADKLTMVSLISSCSQMGALALGEWVHTYIEKFGIEFDEYLAAALVDMYAKCGDLDRSRRIFQEMPRKDVALWNSMIKALAIHGEGKETLEIFSQMEKNSVTPNDITFIGLLNACSHGGFAEKGLELFSVMQRQYQIVPRIEHYGCVVDLLCRAGRLNDAYDFVKKMPIKPDKVIWGALLSSCRSHQNVELAEEVARKLTELDPNHDGTYVLLSNVYASVGKWRDVKKVRDQMKAQNVQKAPGCSAVELDGVLHEFTAGDKTHPRFEEIYKAWDEIVKKIKPMGYEPDTGFSLKNLDEVDKEEALNRHSEKLALTFALISTENSQHKPAIKIVKNLRICGDCHTAMEFVSKLEGREIIVRDRNRFHHFKAGLCSCGGYW
ncbi:hypothetical protein MKX03_011731 [Papaver bracteatum]|nr:hypothetical protein MKX03_011731 [Papaver bracteatum]